MNALIDTNVIVDVLEQREPFFADSSRVLDRAERGEYSAWLCATTVTTVFYLVRRHLGTEEAVERLRDLTAICAVAAVNHSVIAAALGSRITDFEDAVLDHAAVTAGADCIVTRNEPDFRHSSLLIYSPSQFLSVLDQTRAEQAGGDQPATRGDVDE